MMDFNVVIPNTVMIPTSVGDLIDRISILKLKSDRIKKETQLKHVRAELDLLVCTYNKIKKSLKNPAEIEELENKLMGINAKLWDCEDQIRQQVNDIDVARIARAIIHTNNLRSAIKYQINLMLNSPIVEEKSYS